MSAVYNSGRVRIIWIGLSVIGIIVLLLAMLLVSLLVSYSQTKQRAAQPAILLSKSITGIAHLPAR